MATSFEVRGITHSVSGAQLPDFASFDLGHPASVDPAIIAAGPHIVPLFIDNKKSQIVFAEVSESLDLRRAAFAFVELHQRAERAVQGRLDDAALRAACGRVSRDPDGAGAIDSFGIPFSIVFTLN